MGRYYEIRDCELLPRPRAGGPPLMIGSIGPRMLRIALPHVESWNAWFDKYGNRPDGAPALLAQVDEACRDVGRDPTEVERTLAVLVAFEGAVGRQIQSGERQEPVQGSDEEVARTLAAYADAGVSHLQLVLDPITTGSIERAGRVLELLDRL